MTTTRKLPSSFNARKSTRNKKAWNQQSNMEQFLETENIKESIISRDLNDMHKIQIQDINMLFPFKPYDSQMDMMNSVINACNHSQNALLESPTGTGKTLALLISSIAWQQSFNLLMNETKNHDAISPHAKIESPYFSKQSQSSPIRNIELDDINTSKEDKENQDSKSETSIKNLPIVNLHHASLNIIKHENIKYEENESLAISDVTLNNDGKLQYQMIISDKDENTSTNINTKPIQRAPKIFFASRTQKQIQQVIKELKYNTAYDPRTSVLGSKEHYCVHPEVSKSKSKNEDCDELIDNESCRYFHGSKKLIKKSLLEPLRKDLGIFDIEDLNKIGKKRGFCPYYTSKNLSETANVIFMPYNYIIDPLIRERCGIEISDNIIIIDEGHNIEDVSASAASLELQLDELKLVVKELDYASKRLPKEKKDRANLENLLPDFAIVKDMVLGILSLEAIFSERFPIRDQDRSLKIYSNRKILELFLKAGITAQKIVDFNIAFQSIAQKIADSRKQDLVDSIENIKETDKDESDDSRKNTDVARLSNMSFNSLRSLGTVVGYIFEEAKITDFIQDFKFVLLKKDHAVSVDSPNVNGIGFWCLNPGTIFKSISELAKTVILTSGTLSPMSIFEGELATKFHNQVEADHVIKEEQVWVGVVTSAPNGLELRGDYEHMQTAEYKTQLLWSILSICRVIPKGILVFLPSYSSLDSILNFWRLNNLIHHLEKLKTVFEEPRKEGFDKLIKDYETAVNLKTGAILFCIHRGKMSEGIDFSNDKARGVICVGIPFPNVKDVRVKLKKDYNDANMNTKNLLSGNDWYNIQAYRALNQAIGRCIRHREDWGAIILLDSRLKGQHYQKNLSKWVRSKTQTFEKHVEFKKSLQLFIESRMQPEINAHNENE